MLIMKSPIKLKIGLPTSVASDAFCQRMSGNYSLMNARITPKDLLFLTTQPPELPEDLGGMNLTMSNAYTDVRNVTMEVVNNVVNRILLDGHNNFTYQDQVYITTVLNKLGVTDVSYFMQEVRRLREEQNNQMELTKLYQQVIERTLLNTHPVQHQVQRVAIRESASSQPVMPSPRYYIHNDIFNRLETENIYQEISNVYHTAVQQGDRIENKELRIAEQLRLSRDLHLAQLKQNYLNSENVELHHHINRFEQGIETADPVTEEAVLSRAAEAVLLSTVDKVLTHVLLRQTTQREPWVRIKNSLHQTAENTINRFEYFHSEAPVWHRQGDLYLSGRQSKIEEEINLMQSITQLHSQQATMIHQHLPESEVEVQQLEGHIENYIEQTLPTQYREGDIHLDQRRSSIEEEINLMQSVTQLQSQQATMIHQHLPEVATEAQPQVAESAQQSADQAVLAQYREGDLHLDQRRSSIEEEINLMQSVTQLNSQQTTMIHQHLQEAEAEAQQLERRTEKPADQILPIEYREGDLYLDQRRSSIEEEINLMQSVTQLQSQQATMIHQHLQETVEMQQQVAEGLEKSTGQVTITQHLAGDLHLDQRRSSIEEEINLMQSVMQLNSQQATMIHQHLQQAEAEAQQLEHRTEKPADQISHIEYREGDLHLDQRWSGIEEEINLMQSVMQLNSQQATMIHQHLQQAEAEAQQLEGRVEKSTDQVVHLQFREGNTYLDLRQGNRYEENSLLQQVTREIADKETLVHYQPAQETGAEDTQLPEHVREVTASVERQRLETERILHERLVQNQAQQQTLEEMTPAAVAAQLRNETVIRRLYQQIGEPNNRSEGMMDGQGAEYFHDRYYETSAVTRELLYQNEPTAQTEDMPSAPQTVNQVTAEMITRELKEIDRQNRQREEYFRTLEQKERVETRMIQADAQQAMRDVMLTVEQNERIETQLQQTDTQRVMRDVLRTVEQNERIETQLQQAGTQRTMRDALRALEQPEMVLRELQEAGEQNEKSRTPAVLEHILQGADSTTRQILETVLNYERNPEAALADGKVQKNNLGMLNADAARFRETPAVLTHREEPAPENSFTQITAEEIKVFEMFREQPQQVRQRVRKPGQWDKAPIVLRREDNTAMEELVERLEEQRIRQMENQAVYYERVHNTVVRTDLEEQTRSVVTHNTEDIVELVNRTMARQMNTITDQVYRQMERKLQTERSRRGRF